MGLHTAARAPSLLRRTCHTLCRRTLHKQCTLLFSSLQGAAMDERSNSFSCFASVFVALETYRLLSSIVEKSLVSRKGSRGSDPQHTGEESATLEEDKTKNLHARAHAHTHTQRIRQITKCFTGVKGSLGTHGPCERRCLLRARFENHKVGQRPVCTTEQLIREERVDRQIKRMQLREWRGWASQFACTVGSVQ